MKEKNGQMTSLDFNIRLHRMGRIWTSIGILCILSVPIVIGVYYKAMPIWEAFADGGVITLIFINLLSSIGEPVIYAPMLGTNGEYLAFITGNLSNLKIPCVVKAQEIAETKLGTEENELVSTIAIAVSSLVTILIIAAMVTALAVSPLQEAIKANKFITPAFGCVVYALFGSLGGKYIVKNPKLAIWPALLLVVLSVGLALAGMKLGSMSLFVGIAIAAVFALLQFLRERNNLRRKEETRRLEAIAAGMSYEQIVAIEKAQLAEEAALKAASQKKKRTLAEEARSLTAEAEGIPEDDLP